ncbi:hypothetical protein [Singulisphaera acidiphila]|uniref:Uncharacterized protein n=1 Tax=Singulisphaera acidiphila (strain ATCC BAA-1392 / DSM 18658 / VKM B-2454 / MOB10) TaxID=886293 RepID=L0DLD2_SINAD|nr:hypothetical protein [Singulisphaera acidiphila]AGA30204.1 hypothetical protein Sinac_6099 [Singulisphaera acidiphila DSM 18658]
MNAFYVSEIKNARQNQLFEATRISLGIAWKLTVSALVLAIILGWVKGPTQSEKRSWEAPQPVKVEKIENHYRVITQLPPGHESLRIELIDPLGQKHLLLTYGKDGIINSSTHYKKSMRIGYAIVRGIGETVNIRTPGADYQVRLHESGHSYVTVEALTKDRTRLGHIRVSPKGEQQPISDPANPQ